MAMSHANCTHPRTPAGRAACRKLGVHLATVAAPDVTPEIKITGPVARRMARTAAKVDAARTTPKLSAKNMKKTGTHLRTEADMADMPRLLGHGVRVAWARGMSVTVGPVFREDERIVVAHGTHAMVYMTWRPGTELHRISTLPNNTSVWTVRNTIEGAMRIAMGAETE